MSDKPTPRTLLEQLIQQSDKTVEEHCKEFARHAQMRNERLATLSLRQLGRWMSGEVDSARPASRRVAKELWGFDFKRLLGSPASTEIVARQDKVPPSYSHVIHHSAGDRPSNSSRLHSLCEEILMTADDAARFVRRAGVTINMEVIGQYEADVRDLAVAYLLRPPYALFRPLAALRHDIFDALDRHPRPEYVSDLYRVGGRVSALLAHASSDLGQPSAADSHARTAWICADLAKDHRLAAYIRWVQSNVAYWRGDYAGAARVAHSGLTLAETDDDALRLLSQEARALSALKNYNDADRTLGTAGDVRARLLDALRPSGGAFDFGPGKAAYYCSEARLMLGGKVNINLAVKEAREAVEILTSRPDGENSGELLAAATLDLASALLALDNADGAIEEIQSILDLPSANRTIPIVGRVARIRADLDNPRFAGSPIVDSVKEQIEIFQAYTAARDLPMLEISNESSR